MYGLVPDDDRWLDPAGQYEIDWGHPLAIGLVSFVVPGLGVDLVGRPFKAVQGSIPQRSSPWGVAGDFNGTSSAINLGIPLASTASGWSLMAAFVPDVTPNGSALIAERYEGGNVAYSLGFGHNDASGRLDAGFYTGGWSLPMMSGNVTPARPYVAIASCFAPSLVGYLNGAAPTVTTVSGNQTPNLDTFVGRRHDEFGGAPYFDGAIAVAAIWGRALNAGEAAMLNHAPFQMLRRLN